MYQVHSPTSDTDGFAMAVNKQYKITLCAASHKPRCSWNAVCPSTSVATEL